ncbi:MAG: NAD(P)/FAD-dependent oxidoreductase, partial [Spirochaetales bacterium]|nr:NAD(P)/FAD-dependent oxidoreductase [Spirochaetales bacterium]
MDKEFDVVVAGAGNAGLIAAIKLQKAGKRTLIVEQHNVPGGCATSYVRGRFEIDPSLHELCSVGSLEHPGSIRRMFDELGVRVNWVELKDCFRAVGRFSDGSPMDITMPCGKEAMIDAMEKEVPGVRKKMERLFRLFDEVNEGLGYFSDGTNYNIRYALKHFSNMLIVGSHSCKVVFKALRLPQKCIDILSTYWSYLGVDMSRMSFLHYAMMVSSYMEEGAYIPAFTSHELSVALEDRFRELGGTIWFNCRAESFLFNDGKVCGVRTSYGDVSCRYALANVNEDIVYGSMVPKEIVTPRLRRLSNARKQKFGARMFTVHLCLDVTREDLGINDYSIFMLGSADSEKEYANIMRGMEHNTFAIFVCYNVANPKASPEGTCMCSITTFGSPVDWDNLRPEDYAAFKEKCARKLIRQLKDNTGIDLEGHIEEIAIASPWTFARYLGTPEGCVYGHETADWDDIISRSLQMGKDYPVKGLKPIGAGGPRGDGYSSAYQCGDLMAGMVLRELEEAAV